MKIFIIFIEKKDGSTLYKGDTFWTPVELKYAKVYSSFDTKLIASFAHNYEYLKKENKVLDGYIERYDESKAGIIYLDSEELDGPYIVKETLSEADVSKRKKYYYKFYFSQEKSVIEDYSVTHRDNQINDIIT